MEKQTELKQPVEGTPTEAPHSYTAAEILNEGPRIESRFAVIVRDNVDKIREVDIPWDAYQRAAVITEQQATLIKEFDKQGKSKQIKFISENGPETVKLLFELLQQMNKDESILYLLVLINDLLESKTFLSQFSCMDTLENIFSPTLRILNRPDVVIQTLASSILASLLKEAPETKESISARDSLLSWSVKGLTASEHFQHSAVASLKELLRQNRFRLSYIDLPDGVSKLVKLAVESTKSVHSFQLLYDTLYVIWLLSYCSEGKKSLVTENVDELLVNALRRSQKEKIIRIVLCCLKNLVDDGPISEKLISHDAHKVLLSLGLRQYGDEDLMEDLNELSSLLDNFVTDLISFERYKREVLSHELTWSPVHKSEKFWRDNVQQFEQKDFQVLRVLVKLLNNSQDPLVLTIACHDVGEFVRFHPNGKFLIDKLRGKSVVMSLLQHQDAEVRHQALLCVQKMMVSSWRFLSSDQQTKS